MITYKIKIDLQSERERYEDIVFTTGDKHGYCLEFSFYDNGQKMNTAGYGLTVKAKRADGAVIIDNAVTDENGARYVVADNAYGAAGELELEIALSRADGSYVTAKVLHMTVREGFGEEGLEASDNTPILAKLEAQALAVQGAVNTMQSELTSHKTDAAAHEEAFSAERKRFNPLYCNALFGSAEGESITVSDAVEGTPLALTLYGKCTETLSDSSAEKSPDNPAVITGIGESGSVTVTVTDADGTEQTLEVSVSKPLYDLTTSSASTTRRDKITPEGIYIQTNRISLDTINFVGYISPTYADGCTEFYTTDLDSAVNATNAMRQNYKLLITHFGWYQYHYNPNKDTDNIWGETVGGGARFRIIVRDSFLNLTDTDTKEEKIAKLQNWLTAQKDAGTPVEMIYGLETVRFESSEKVSRLPATATAATFTNSDGADMRLTYNRDINKALAEINNAIIALGGTI